MKKILALLLALCMLSALVACTSAPPADSNQGQAEPSAPAEDAAAGGKVGISSMFAHQYFDIIRDGVEDALGSDWEVVELNAENDAEKQINDIDDLLAQNIDCLFLEAVDSVAIKPALEACKAAGVPVICVDAPVQDTDLVVTMVCTDNYMAGVKCAEDLAERLGGAACKAVVLGNPTTESARLRENGFVDTAAKYDNIEIVVNQDYQVLQEKAQEIMENAIQSHPDINAVFSQNEMGIFAAIAVLEGANMIDDAYLYAVNGASAEIEMITQGKQTATAAQLPYEMGFQAGEQYLALLDGKTVDPETLIAPLLVTADNGMIDTYEPAY